MLIESKIKLTKKNDVLFILCLSIFRGKFMASLMIVSIFSFVSFSLPSLPLQHGQLQLNDSWMQKLKKRSVESQSNSFSSTRGVV